MQQFVALAADESRQPPHDTQIEPVPHRQLVQRGIGRVPQLGEPIRFQTGQADLETQPGQFGRQQGRDNTVTNTPGIDILAPGPNTSILEASQILINNNVACLPVETNQGSITGVVTWKDIFKAYIALP